jgi:hypothetical protein
VKKRVKRLLSVRAGGVVLAKPDAARYQVQAFSASLPEAPAWSAAIAQLVEHVIRNDGVTGSNPVCGTAFPSNNIRSHPKNQYPTVTFSNLSSEVVRDDLLVSEPKCWYIRWYPPTGMEMYQHGTDRSCDQGCKSLQEDREAI